MSDKVKQLSAGQVRDAAQRARVAATDEVKAAEKAAAQAAELVTELEKAVAAGDEKITPDQLAAQEHLAKFARLRVEATKRKLEAAQKAEVVAQADEFEAIVEEHAASDVVLADLLHTALNTLRQFKQAVEKHNETASRWHDRAAHYNRELAKFGEPPRFSKTSYGLDVVAGRTFGVINPSSFAGRALRLLNAEGLLLTQELQGGVDPDVWAKLAELDLVRGQSQS